jgi:type II secretory pathway pseudopilin PulG
MAQDRQPNGFTLLEILVALIVLDFLVVGLGQGVRTGLHLWAAEWNGATLPQLIRVQLSFVKGDTRHWPDLIVAAQLAAPEG